MASLSDWPWRHWAARCPERCALRDARADWSWRALTARIDELAADFTRQSVMADEVVALRGKNSLPMLLCYLALLQCGARVLPLNPQLPDAVQRALLPTLGVRHALCLCGGGWPSPLTALDYSPASSSVASCLGVPWRPESLATLTLTSGSSGVPKAAAHTFAAHIASACGVLQLMAFGPQDCWLLSLPLFHVSGQGIVWRWLTAGATLAVHDGQLPLENALQGCSHASLVPTQLWRLLARDTLPDTLNAVLLGGAAIPRELAQQAEARGVRCWCGYGLTELASTVCAKRADGRAGVGLPLAGREVRLIDGEILLRGGSLASGYWRDGRLMPLTDAQGWFHTRDGGAFHDGEWHILGRLDNQFFSGGEGIQPEDIEAVLLTHPAVRQACVVPVDDAEFGQRPAAVVDAADETPLAAIRRWLEPQLAGYQRPAAYFRLPEELKNGGIKISRRQVKEWVRRQT